MKKTPRAVFLAALSLTITTNVVTNHPTWAAETPTEALSLLGRPMLNVPRHVREDTKWMASLGAEVVVFAILEQDFEAARFNLDIICAEAEKAGMKTNAVPSRWAGLVAGSPKVPSQFAAAHPQICAQNADGSPQISEFSGPQCSVFDAQTREFFFEVTQRLLAFINVCIRSFFRSPP